VQDSFTGYLLCVLSDECVAGHNERITHITRVLCDSREFEARNSNYIVYCVSNERDSGVLEVEIVPTLIPEESRAVNLPPVEHEAAPYISATIFFVTLGAILAVIAFDIPALIL